MKRLQYDRYGAPEVMRLAEFEPAPPGPGEVLVRVRAAACSALDWRMRNGEMKLMTGRSFPRAMGHDFAGVVEAVGAGVTRVKAGDAVLGGARFRQAGAFAKMIRSALPGPFRAMMGRPVTADLTEVARTLRVPIAGTVALAEAIPALTELEREQRPKGGKLVIIMG